MNSLGWIIIDAEEVVKDEIWSVTTQKSRRGCEKDSEKLVFYVLEPTCEVIGMPSNTCSQQSRECTIAKPKPSSFDNIPLRADWSEYVQRRLLGPNFYPGPPTSLMDHLRWSHYEEYYHGISRHWLSQIDKEGQPGKQKKEVAERYIMACLVANR